MSKLCVNIDHIATVREARKAQEPDPLEGAKICLAAGVSGITIHLREDRRHIQDHDLHALRREVTTMLNLEMAATDPMVRIALEQRVDQVTLVPEKREEVTTEGGLDVVANEPAVTKAVDALQGAGIPVSLFIDPDTLQIEATLRTGAQLIELHTGRYCNVAPNTPEREEEFRALVEQSANARAQGLIVNAGHGLDYQNVQPVAAIEGMHELNIGHSIISRSIFVGLAAAVTEMLQLVGEASQSA